MVLTLPWVSCHVTSAVACGSSQLLKPVQTQGEKSKTLPFSGWSSRVFMPTFNYYFVHLGLVDACFLSV